MILYYDRAGREVTQELGAALLAENKVRRTAISDDVEVSTIHLVINHRYGDGPPLIFETLVFGGPLDGDGDRWASEAEAIVGHELWVRRAAGHGGAP
jgi:hypothetical protein